MKKSLASLFFATFTLLFFSAAPLVYASGGVTPTAPSVSQAFSNTPSIFNQGDGADQISIAVANTSPAIALTTSLQVNGSLPAGIAINTSSFASGDWACASGAAGSVFTCVRQTPLAANASDAILLPVSVASNAPTGSNGLLTDTISGGGLASVVNGSEQLTVTAAPLAVSCTLATTGQVGVAYSSVPMVVSGGTTPYTYSVVGTIAPGLTLNPSTGALTGTPTAPGAFLVKVTDSNAGGSSTTCPVMIAAPPTGTCSLGMANGYNLIALSGDFSDAADITGRIAAAGQVMQATTIGSDLRTSDPYMGFASGNGGPWAIVAGGGIPTSNAFNVNAGGNVYSSIATNASFNFVNEDYSGSAYAGSTLVTGGSSPIDFATLSTNLQTLSGQLNAAPANGTVCSVDNSGSMVPGPGCPSNPVYFNPTSQHYNPSWIVLYGTSAAANIFNITQDQFQSSSNLDIEVPTGSTVIVNVPGTSDILQSGVYFQGNMVTDANAGEILFNFPDASSVTINAQLDGSVLAPNAVLSGISQMGGVFLAASVGSTGEVHYDPFNGSIPSEICSPGAPGPLSVTCAAVTAGEVGLSFNSGPIKVSGGTAPYSYSIAGALPAGLSLDSSTGAITGSATASGTFSVQVKDASGATGTGCPITINDPLSVTSAAVTGGEVGLAFNSGSIKVSGGAAPYTYSIVGTLPAGLTLNPMTGAVTGTPTASGMFSVRVTDAHGATGTGNAITINGPLSVTCAAVTTGEAGIAFNSGPMTVSGGAAPYTYSIVGTLPAGLTLNPSSGAISGTPAAAGTFSVQVKDGNGATSTACPITISAALSVSCAAVTKGEAAIAFNSGPMTVSGGAAPYTYSVVGTLPAGLTLNPSSGAISGTPAAAGTFSVQVRDANGAIGTACPITINALLSVTCAAVTSGKAGIAFNSGPMTVSGGTAPYSYSILGVLPSGLTLNATTGAVTGTSTASGTFSIQAKDALGATGVACPITINAPSAPLSVTCAAVTGQVGVPFNSSVMTVSGGTAPYSYSIIGTLPAGLSLNATTGAITGTPTAAGTFSIKATDAAGATGTACAITITAGTPLKAGDTATIGYWQNKNGQALIDALNGGSSATQMANWLATNFPYLYGANSSNDLTGKTNADVAALFLTYFGGSAPKTSAQVMAGAIAVYVTNANLAGSTVAAGYGFNVSSTGTGAKIYNVSSDGTGAGLQNNASYTVMQLLQQANLQTQQGSFNANSFNTIFTNINQTGDLTGGSTGLSVTCAATKAGQVGVAFNSGPIAVTGGSGSYKYSILGTLPAGLALNTTTGAVSGTPTAAGAFSVQVVDSTGTAGVSCPITIGAGFTLTVNPSSLTVVAGQSASTTFTFAPYGGYVGSVSFSCSGLPAGASCAFTPAALTADGSNTVQTSNLTITTTASGTTTVAQNRNSSGLSLASILYCPGILLGGLIAWRRRSFTARVRGLLLLVLVGTALVGGAVGCSSFQYRTPLGAHVVTVVAKTTVSSTASTGSDATQTADFTLTITQ